MSVTSEIIVAVAEVLRAVAWPSVAVFAAYRYRSEVGRLIDRLRKGGPAEFDPVPIQQSKPPESLPAQIEDAGNAIQHLRTPAVKKLEEELQRLLPSPSDPTKRETVLVTLTAKAVLVAQFERTEAVIYASQLELLNHLNTRPNGESAERVRELFYDPAVKRFPEIYKNYPFENYIGFLQASWMLVVANLQVGITDQGREYLVWRIEQQKLPHTIG